MIRGVILPTTVSGVAAATMLGMGRALGEAIAVLSVIGDGSQIHGSLFETGNSLASRIAIDSLFPVSALDTSSLFYLARAPAPDQRDHQPDRAGDREPLRRLPGHRLSRRMDPTAADSRRPATSAAALHSAE